MNIEPNQILAAETPARTVSALNLALTITDKLSDTLIAAASKDQCDPERLPEGFLDKTQQAYELALWRLGLLLEDETLWSQFKPNPQVQKHLLDTLQESENHRAPNFSHLKPTLTVTQSGVAFVYEGVNITVSGHGSTVEQARKDFETACKQRIELQYLEPATEDSPAPSEPSGPPPAPSPSDASSPSDVPTDTGSTGGTSSSS